MLGFLYYGIVHGNSVFPHQLLAGSQHALMSAELLGIAFAGNGLAIIDVHDVHRSVADVAEHVHAAKLPQPIRHGGKALREHIGSGKLCMIALASEGKVCLLVLEQIGFESLLLFADPSEGQPCREMDAGAGQPAQVQLDPMAARVRI